MNSLVNPPRGCLLFHRMAMLVGFAWLVPAKGVAAPPSPSPTVSYHQQIRPLFQQHCYGCHQAAKSNGDYILTDYRSLMNPGETGKASVVPGKPEASYLFDEIRLSDGKAEMPKNREPLKPEEIELVRLWIAQGAKDDSPVQSNGPDISPEKPPVYQALPVVTGLAISPEGQQLAVTGYHEVLIYNTKTDALEARLIGLSERVQSLAWAPQGNLLAVAAGNPGRSGELQVWDVSKKRLKLSVPAGYDTIYGVSWSPDGTMIAYGGADNTVRAVDSRTGQQVLFMATHADWVFGTVFSRTGKHLASVSRDMSMKLTEVPTQRFIDNITSITPGALKGGLMAVAIRPLPDQKPAKVPDDTPGVPPEIYDELLCAGSDGIPRLYKMHREAKRVIGDDLNRLKEYPALPGRISGVAFNRDGSRFAAVSSLDGKGQLRIYETDSGKLIECTPTSGPLYAVAWDPQGAYVVAAGFDGQLLFFDAASGQKLRARPAAPLKTTPPATPKSPS